MVSLSAALLTELLPATAIASFSCCTLAYGYAQHKRARALQDVAVGFALPPTDDQWRPVLASNPCVRDDKKVINTLGMNKEEMTEVLDTFDAELLALSRINTPHIVKVRNA